MQSLKLASEQDAAEVASLFRSLFDNSVYSTVTSYQEEDVAKLVISLIRQPDRGVTILLMDEDRIVGAVICSSARQVFNSAEKTAVEVAFWIIPEYRTRANLKNLLGAYKYWARKTGCTTIMYGKLKDKGSVESYIVRKL